MKATNLKQNINGGIFSDLKGILSGYNLESVAESAGCAYGTLYNWMAGKTKSPRLCTIIKVAKAVGCELKLTKLISTPTLRIVK